MREGGTWPPPRSPRLLEYERHRFVEAVLTALELGAQRAADRLMACLLQQREAALAHRDIECLALLGVDRERRLRAGEFLGPPVDPDPRGDRQAALAGRCAGAPQPDRDRALLHSQ